MGFTATLKVNSSPKEKIGKTLSAGTDFTVVLKENTSILNPVLVVRSNSNLSGYNYMYISEFSRYYFIDDIRLAHDAIWEISAHVDVLETYATAIKANSAVIRRQAGKYNLYLPDGDFKTYQPSRIQTLKFSKGDLTKALQYVLVVNGGT